MVADQIFYSHMLSAPPLYPRSDYTAQGLVCSYEIPRKRLEATDGVGPPAVDPRLCL
jgi:hypothetical protein